MVVELNKSIYAGIYITAEKITKAYQVSHKSQKKLFVASSNPVILGDALEGIEAKIIFGISGADMFKETLFITFGGFLPEALTKGLYKVAPPPEVVPTKGLEGIQGAFKRWIFSRRAFRRRR